MRRRPLITCLALVGSAGCLRLSETADTPTRTQAETAAATQTPTRTAVAAQTTRTRQSTETHRTSVESETPTDTATPVPDYPPGLTEDGVNELLWAAHTGSLDSTGFRATWQKLDHESGEHKWDKTYRADATAAIGEWQRTYGGPVTIFRSTDSGYWQEVLGDRTIYGDDGAGRRLDRVLWGLEIVPLLRAAAWDRPEHLHDTEPPVWSVSTDAIDEPSAIPGYYPSGTVDSISGQLEVREDGVIRRLEALYAMEDQHGDPHTFEITYEVDSIGAVSIERPDWVETAPDHVPDVTATLTDDRRFIRLTVDSGAAIAVDSRLVVTDTTDTESESLTHLDADLEPGDAVYLYRTPSEGTHNLHLSRDGRPSDVTVDPFEFAYELTGYRRDTRYFRSTVE